MHLGGEGLSEAWLRPGKMRTTGGYGVRRCTWVGSASLKLCSGSVSRSARRTRKSPSGSEDPKASRSKTASFSPAASTYQGR